MAVSYSPLCETNELAYLAYCIASYGSSVGQYGAVSGSSVDSRCGDRGVDSLINFVVDGGNDSSAWSPWVALLGGAGVKRRGGIVGDSGGGAGSGESAGVGGSAGVCVGGSGSSSDGGGCDEAGVSGAGDTNGAVDAKAPLGAQGVAAGVELGFGKHYKRNKCRRERAKVLRSTQEKLKRNWRVDACPSLSESVRTVDTRTAEEIEAVRTLAVRRTMENKVAAVTARHRLMSLTDEDKTRTVKKLHAQRLAQRINEATEKAQASYARCDNSLKSLGSTGSAGEFALKQSLKSQDALEKKIANLEEQLRVALQLAGPEGWSAVAAVPEPEPVGIRDVMDEPNEHWSEEETVAYYDILNEESVGNYDTDWASYFPKK